MPMDKILIIFRVGLNFDGYTGYDSSYMPSSPLGVYVPLVIFIRSLSHYLETGV